MLAFDPGLQRLGRMAGPESEARQAFLEVRGRQRQALQLIGERADRAKHIGCRAMRTARQQRLSGVSVVEDRLDGQLAVFFLDAAEDEVLRSQLRGGGERPIEVAGAALADGAYDAAGVDRAQ